MIAGLKTGLHSFNPETGNFALLHVVEPHAPNNRLNDGFVDSDGFLWFGSMDDNEEDPSGALYQLTEAGCLRRDPGYVVSNGPAESPDGRIAVSHRHARRRHLRLRSHARRHLVQQTRVRAFRRRRGISGRAHRRRRRLRLDRRVRWLGPQALLAAGRTAVDAATALLGRDQGGFRRRRSAGRFTSPPLHVALDAEQRKQQPLAGGLFRVRVDVPGLPQGIVSHGI